MPDNSARVFGGRWRVERRLGRGGQGVVYEVADTSGLPSRDLLVRHIQGAFRTMQGELNMMSPDAAKFDDFVEMIRTLSRSASVLPRAALKELLPFEDAVNANTAIERMTRELAALEAVTHPALIAVIDSHLEQRWFVTEFFGGGTLAGQIDRYRGQPLAALKALRPLVDAVATLHAQGIVHRDIKPDNVFIGDDGRLVLGDCGLAIRLDDIDRLTDTYENVGSRDWMPGWAQSMRLQDVQPTFDVFSLGKLLWAMVAGTPRLRLWYHERREFDLRHIFPNVPDVHRVTRILAGCVCEDEDEMTLTTGAELRAAVDQAIIALEAGAELPSTRRRMRCRFCGVGGYVMQGSLTRSGYTEPTDTQYTYRCDLCGHLELFYWPQNQRPAGWTD